MKLNAGFVFTFLLQIIHHLLPPVHAQACTVPALTSKYVRNIFTKYTGAPEGLNKTGLQSLLESLKLDKLTTVCEEGDTECQKNKLHLAGADTDPLKTGGTGKSRQRRGAGPRAVRPVNATHVRTMKEMQIKCNNVRTTLSTSYNIADDTVIDHDEFLALCPFLLSSVDDKVCRHYHDRYPEFKPPELPPSNAEKWGYGVLAITICSM